MKEVGEGQQRYSLFRYTHQANATQEKPQWEKKRKKIKPQRKNKEIRNNINSTEETKFMS